MHTTTSTATGEGRFGAGSSSGAKRVTEPLAHLQTLLAWLSPGYPVGAYSYSHGLEWAVEAGDVADPASLAAWIADIVAQGAGRTDAILTAHAMAADDPRPLAELAEALAPSAERHLETMAQGAAFARVTSAAYGIEVPAMAYPVAVGYAARRLGLPADATVMLALQGFAANLVSAGVRLVPVGQTDGQRILVGLMPLVARVADAALTAPLSAIGGLAQRGDLAAMRHETQYSRLYRS
jgi:urease accessory protein